MENPYMLKNVLQYLGGRLHERQVRNNWKIKRVDWYNWNIKPAIWEQDMIGGIFLQLLQDY